MCHESPSAQFLGAMVTILGDVFMVWHLWRYDKFRCLLFTRRSAFRFIIVWKFIVSMALFTAWNVILVWVKYEEYYAVVPISPTESEIMPVPFQLWDAHKQRLVRASYYMLAIAWALVLAIHSEETLYWAYLIGSIRKRSAGSWFGSIWFKVWLASCVLVCGVLPGVANVETTNLIKMEGNIFMTGSILASCLFSMSMWLLFVFPSFIKESRRQGANPEVISRLYYFKELNTIRTIFRMLYVACILTLSIDGFTEHKHVNSSPFWLDLFYVCGLVFVFTSNGLSLMILLPRNLESESGLPQPANVFVRQQPRPAQRSTHTRHMHVLPSSSTVGSTNKYNDDEDSPTEDLYDRDLERSNENSHGNGTGNGRLSGMWGVLGERLNVEKAKMDNGMDECDSNGAVAIALGHTDLRRSRTAESSASRGIEAPFAPMGGERVLRPGEEVHHSPQVLNNFRSPADVAQPPPPRDINIVVMTEQHVEKA
ncbi:hypothetical protein IAU59_005303 [Kwoniella sp. CBS 9459]